MKNAILILIIPALMCMNSCKGGGESANETSEPDAPGAGEIVLSMEQFSGSGMKVGAPRLMMFSNEVSANGTLAASLSGRAEVNTLISGRVKKINQQAGEQVSVGDVLFQLESHEIIQVQQEYAEVVQEMVLLQADYERKKSLSSEKIVAQKEFQKTESAYRSILARVEGLKARLNMMNINPARVEEGTIVPVLSVRSPIGGIVTRQDLVLGQYVGPGLTVMEVVDTRKLQLMLRVFEGDLSGLAVGQTVRFYIPGQEQLSYEASLSHIGKSIDPETKTIQCIAQLKAGDRGAFVNNLYVESKIITCQREALAVPESALTREADRDFAWIRVGESEEGMTFRKVPVKTGVTRDGYTEIIEEGLTDVLLEGAYNLWSED